MQIKQFLTYLAVLGAVVFWGFSFIWSKQVFETFDPITTIFFRLIISSFFLLIIGFISKKLKKIKRTDYLSLMLIAFFEPFLYFLGENIGLSYVSSTIAAVIVATIPLFSPIAAYAFLGEKISVMNIVGILISIAGVTMVILKDNLSLAANPVGIMFLFIAVFAAIGYSILAMRLSKKYNIFTLVTIQNSIGAVYFIPLFLIFEFDSFLQAEITSQVLIPLFELAIFASSIAFILFTYGIKQLGVTRTNSLANLIPVFTAIFAFYILGEKLYFINIMGILVVVGGLFMSQIKLKRKKKHFQTNLSNNKKDIYAKKYKHTA